MPWAVGQMNFHLAKVGPNTRESLRKARLLSRVTLIWLIDSGDNEILSRCLRNRRRWKRPAREIKFLPRGRPSHHAPLLCNYLNNLPPYHCGSTISQASFPFVPRSQRRILWRLNLQWFDFVCFLQKDYADGECLSSWFDYLAMISHNLQLAK